MQLITPITNAEFFHLFQRCIPPGGWPGRLAVANSGGPDSVCLLSLIALLIKKGQGTTGLPSELVSIHIDHDLQPANAQMAERAHRTALACNVPSHVSKIPWSIPPFPDRPTDAAPLEEIARDARQNRILYKLLYTQTRCIAYAHHADDQVETSIMRLAKGSGMRGAAGMRPVRRMGMGDSTNKMSFTGALGMNHWVIRPLLGISKDRILATCEARDIQYETDPTNFQPELTLRNYIRHYLKERESQSQLNPGPEYIPSHIPFSFVTPIGDIGSAIKSLRSQCPGNGDMQHLRQAVQHLGNNLEKLDVHVSESLKHCVRSSPPSTILLAGDELAKITDPEVRNGVVRRILRTISPRPWGSQAAEGYGNRTRIENIVAFLWPENQAIYRKRFGMGSRVLWVPVSIREDGIVKARPPLPNEIPSWVAQREAPMRDGRYRTAQKAHPLMNDLTSAILKSRPEKGGYQQLYDCRFLIHLDIPKIPGYILASLRDPELKGRVVVEPDSTWYLPKVVWQRNGYEPEVLASYQFDKWEWRICSEQMELQSVPWISISFIRPMEAL